MGSYVLLFYSVISILSIHLYNSEYSKGMFQDLEVFPYVYLFTLINISIIPIYYIDSRKINFIDCKNKKLFRFTSFIIILLSFYDIKYVFSNIESGLYLLFIDESYGRNAYELILYNMNTSSDNNIDYISVISNTCKLISLPFLLYSISSKNRDNLITFGLLISSSLMPINSVSMGSRGALGMLIFNLAFGYLFVQRFLDLKLKKYINIIIVSLLSVLIVPFMLVTISRGLGNSERIIYSIERYLSEGFIRFNNYGLDANGVRYGDYTMVIAKWILGLDPAKSYYDRIVKYNRMSMNESVFYTYVGDFTLDYGMIATIIIFIVLTYICCRFLYIRNNTMYFDQFLLYYLLLISVIGYYQYPLGRIEGNLQLLSLLLISFLFKCIRDFNKHELNNE